MSIYRERLRNTSNALSPRVSDEQMRFQVPPKLFGVNSWIPRIIGQWIPDCWSGNRKSTGPKVPRRTRGTNSWWRLADRRCWRPGTSENGTQQYCSRVVWMFVVMYLINKHINSVCQLAVTAFCVAGKALHWPCTVKTIILLALILALGSIKLFWLP